MMGQTSDMPESLRVPRQRNGYGVSVAHCAGQSRLRALDLNLDPLRAIDASSDVGERPGDVM
jgi:hypothetical protein